MIFICQKSGCIIESISLLLNILYAKQSKKQLYFFTIAFSVVFILLFCLRFLLFFYRNSAPFKAALQKHRQSLSDRR